MRNFKTAVWIFVMFLVQTVLMNYVKTAGARPDLVLPFIICAALMEDSFNRAMTVSGICALMAASLCGRNFNLALVFYMAAALFAFGLRNRPRYVPDFAKYIVCAVLGGAVLEALSYLLLYKGVGNLGVNAVAVYAVTVVYDALAALILYPILRKTVYKPKTRHLTI